MLEETTYLLGQDPDREHRINANSFQQNALTTVNGWQYAAFYTDAPKAERPGICHVNLARRNVSPGMSRTGRAWETLTLDDYDQSIDDGHNTISIGVCKGDGTIHISFDHHCDSLRFRISELGTAAISAKRSWDVSLFSSTQASLPGIPPNDLMKEVTYPRFVNIGEDLLLTYRIGQAGLGSDVLYRYSAATHIYTYLGQHLTGVSNSPYINGIDYYSSRLHISWCYRNFIPLPPSAGPDAHKQQAGPNGPENNCDLNYAFSDDLGETWKSSNGQILAKIDSKEDSQVERTIKPGTGPRVFEIPMGSGILNQEAQSAGERGFWVLNRENRSGEERWMLYHRDTDGKWEAMEIPSISKPTETGSRASMSVDRNSNVYLILPGNSDSSLSIVKGQKKDAYSTFETIWTGDGFDGEPLVDTQRLEASNILSIFTRTDRKADGKRYVVVADFVLAE